MYHVPHISDRISNKLHRLATNGAALYEAAARGEPMGPRELAQAIELNQQYVDVLAEMEDAPFETDTGVVAEVNERRVRFQDMDGLAEWIAGVME
jgi:hypothetical protein